ncbi:MAG TPA: Hpt domain-containing protein [Phycisphaerae bacterium]|nr:Hpt domain-containing protein [Phycisphaerae bacterium]HRY71040.1 Hpt domain-containing protein [Phycisphaerae bacterium]HSA29348.1 Hpt domain-containing protein [Phycisphaerae bacterium]
MSSSDQPEVFSTLGNDPDMVELIQEFVNALPERVKSIEAAVNANDLDTLRRLAHQLKGASGGYGFEVLGQAAASLEQSAKAASSVNQVTEQVQDFVSLCQRARVAPA